MRHSPHENGDTLLSKRSLFGFEVRPSSGTRKADKLRSSISRLTADGQGLDTVGAKVDRYLRMTSAVWKLNGSMGSVRDELRIPYGKGLPLYDGNGKNYSTESDIRMPTTEEARTAMQELSMERRELLKVALDPRTEEERCIDAADMLADSVEEAHQRQYYG